MITLQFDLLLGIILEHTNEEKDLVSPIVFTAEGY
jgi:hypothetical protein